MVEYLQRQLSLGPEGGDKRRSSLHGLESAASVVAELAEAGRTEIAQFAVLEMSPEVFDWVQFRCIGRHDFQLDGAVEAIDVLTHQTALVNRQAIPDDQHFAFDLALEDLEDFDHLWCLKGAWKQAEVEAGE